MFAIPVSFKERIKVQIAIDVEDINEELRGEGNLNSTLRTQQRTDKRREDNINTLQTC